MKRHYFLTILLATVATAAFPQVSSDNADGVAKIDAMHSRHDFVPGQVLVKFSDINRVTLSRSRGMITTNLDHVSKVFSKYGVDEMEQLLPHENPKRQLRKSRAFNGETIQERDLSQLYLISLSDSHQEETVQMVEDLNALEEVEFAEPNYRVYTLADNNIAVDYSSNPMVSQQWYLDAYGVKELWNKPIINKARPVIAIIDTGVDITHPDLKDNIWTNQAEANGRDDYDNDRNGFKNDIHGWDFINNTGKMRDNNKHGTHVAGIAAAANNGLGIVGANPRALIMPVTVLPSDGIGDIATLIKGIDYAIRNGATVINMSIGTYYNSNALRQALERAYQSAVLVAAAGNDHKCIYESHPHQDTPPMPSFPAAYSFVLGVQATSNAFGSLASFSNYDDDGPLSSCESTAQDPDGFNYELKAPGTKILSTIPGGKYDELQGTSMAAPLVAGAISALQMVKQYDNQEILWGDLLHSENIAEAFNIKSRPAELDITRIVLRDRIKEGENNLKYYDVNVGETINIYPYIRTSFGSASNIKLNIIAPGAEVVTNEADFAYNLDAFGKMTSKNPLVIKIPDDMPNASEINITVVATCKESKKTFSNNFTLRVANMYTLKGMLTEDMTLTPDHVYYVSGKFGVSEGVTLTIKPGTRLEFGKDAGLYGFGTLNVKGTPKSPIIMTAYNKSEPWSGVYSHIPSGRHDYSEIYTNSEKTLFTLLPTKDTPIKMSSFWQSFYYESDEDKPTNLNFTDYYSNWTEDMTNKKELLTDPNYLTPTILKMMSDLNKYYQKYSTQWTDKMNQSGGTWVSFPSWYIFSNPTDTISYCKIDGYHDEDASWGNTNPYYCDCVIHLTPSYPDGYLYPVIFGDRNVITCSEGKLNLLHIGVNHTNFINSALTSPARIYNNSFTVHDLKFGKSNFFNNISTDRNTGKAYMLEVISSSAETVKIDPMPYFGTSREDLLRPLIYEFGNTDGSSDQTYATLDLSNMRKEPYKEAHGIVWKVVVNGKDAQDEQEQLLPLGVGKHKFEVYFNRPMNKAVVPQISFGVVLPYTQHPVSEDGCWNNDGTIYTAYVTIDGKTQSDGMNRIYVRGAEDNEFFECPDEATRFNVMVQAAGSMANGFQADAGLGCVNLKWNNGNNDFEDAMGFNVYRYTQGDDNVNDTIRINTDIIDISATSYVDDQVTPGTTYYYYYKVLSTALQEYDISNVVAATPLTATRGDANGSGSVDVVDVITTVNYITGMSPKPFVFQAADMDSNQLIDIFDVVGIIQGILNPNLLSRASIADATATYSIENGILYIESSASLGGLQVQLISEDNQSITLSEDLNGFETASAWLSESDFLFMAYSMSNKTLAPGRHALLHIGDAKLTSLRLSDSAGHKIIIAEKDCETTGVDSFRRNVVSGHGVYDLSGRKLTIADKQEMLPHGVYIINGKKVVK